MPDGFILSGDGQIVPSDVSLESFVLPGSEFGPPIAEWRVLTEHKEGFFQKASATATWLPRGGEADGFGITEFDIFGLFAVPLPNRDSPLLITPTFNPRYLEGPDAPHLPPELYEAFLDLVWLPKLSERWSGIVSVAPSYYGDFRVSESEAWRLTGRGLARFEWKPDRLQLLFGLLYLNRKDIRILPAGGVIWSPRDDRRYELVFPRPKLAHRIARANWFEDWLYLGGEFGGNSFAFEENGLADFVTLRDYRIYVGLERKLDGGSGYRIEIGYAFSRSAEFASGLPEYNAPDTALLRVGAAY
jgi:hypothetical protein